MMPIFLEQRFRLLLELAKNMKNPAVARENLAAARELVDTLFATGHLDIVESRAYRQTCTAVQVVISRAEISRGQDTRKFNCGIRQLEGNQ